MLTNTNWAEEWAMRLARSNHKARLRTCGISSEDFWDNFTGWPQLQLYTRYPGQALDSILKWVNSRSTVLDIGAGSGALTVPMAKAANYVTAVEPSSGQIDRLRDNAATAGVNNIKIIQKRWEDTTLTELGRHDVVTAAYCFQMMDIRAALQKMWAAAERCIFLIDFVDHDLVEPLRRILGGLETGPDYLFLYNVLYEMGHRASVEIITRDYEMPLDLQLDTLSYTHGLSSEQKQKLHFYLESEGKICSHDGLLWVKRRYKDALIRLEKEEQHQ